MLTVYLTVTLMMILSVGVAVVALLHNQVHKETKTNLSALLTTVTDIMTTDIAVDMTANEAVPSSDERFGPTLSGIAASTDSLIQIYSSDGTIDSYCGSNVLWKKVVESNGLTYTVVSAFPRRTVSEDCYTSNDEHTDTFHTFTAKDTVTLGDEECVVLVSVEQVTFMRRLHDSLLEIILIMLLASLIATLAVYATTERAIQPFMSINAIVQRYSKGDFNVRIPLSNIAEAKQLAKSFNTMADQLNDLEVTRKSFVANVSHELRSPLTSMRGFLEAMEDGTIPAEEHEKYIAIVLSETKRMTTMVNDLLDLARIESGKTALRIETFDINELIRRTLLTFEARIHDNDMDVDVRFASEQFFVEADSAQISQVLRNLIDNAIKYSPSGSKLRLATYAVHRDVYVSVQDSGQGIPEEDLPHVFDRFYKVEKAHTPTKQSGTGLGLSIVKKIIDQHGQSITVQSTKGKGTNFTFTLRRVAPTNKRQTVIPDGGMKNGI